MQAGRRDARLDGSVRAALLDAPALDAGGGHSTYGGRLLVIEWMHPDFAPPACAVVYRWFITSYMDV